MNIAAITKFKSGAIWSLLRKLGWSQSELARRSGLHNSRIGQIINLQRKPSEKEADAIQLAFGNAGEYLDVYAEWPEQFVGLKPGMKVEQFADVDVDSIALHKCPEAFQIAAPEVGELVTEIAEAFDSLTEREKLVLDELCVGYEAAENRQTTAAKFGVNPTRIDQIKNGALRHIQRRVERFVEEIGDPEKVNLRETIRDIMAGIAAEKNQTSS